jgi:AcrR family transcriptional regulator
VLSFVVIALDIRQTAPMDVSAPRTARARARAELTAEIKQTARRHLAESGSSGLSLRAIARDLGMVSSAVYRYFPSRDELLTGLIIDAYEAVGVAAEMADSGASAADLAGRWLAIARAVRQWAIDHPQEYALVYGSPVPGYRAPDDTIAPATRVSLVLLGLLAEAAAAGRLVTDDPAPPLPRSVRTDLAPIRDQAAPGVPDLALAAGLGIWTQMFGAISFELFGHLHNVINDYDAFFDRQMRAAGRTVFT